MLDDRADLVSVIYRDKPGVNFVLVVFVHPLNLFVYGDISADLLQLWWAPRD